MDPNQALAGVALAGLLASIGHLPVTHRATCPAPALPGQHAGYVTAGSRIIGTNGGNGIAPGDVYTCDASGRVTVS